MISVVIPIYNEESNINPLLDRLLNVLLSQNFEIILVNDGSTDNSARLINEYCKKYSCVKLINFSRNFGHQKAIYAGLKQSSGDAVMVMDGDLQDPPEVIPQFVAKWQEGYDVVYAIRKKRKENILKRLAYKVFYRFLNKVAEINIPLDSGDFSIMDRKIVNLLIKLPEKKNFLRGLRAWLGYKQVGLAYERDARLSGKPKFTFSKLVKLAVDGIISFSDKPLKFATNLGMLITIVSFLYLIMVVSIKLFINYNLPGYASLMSCILFLGGIQLFMIGVLGEYIAKIFEETKNRPDYIVSSSVNIETKQEEGSNAL